MVISSITHYLLTINPIVQFLKPNDFKVLYTNPITHKSQSKNLLIQKDRKVFYY